ncbi:MAG: BTAD domain-containing putative transcriptional regulator [Oscillospiraceae bacterium]
MNNTIYISLLEDFSISCSDVTIKSKDLSPQICSLIAYLAINRNYKPSIDTIIESIWTNEITNPVSSIKNLVYRIRKNLENLGFPFAKELVISSSSTYVLNPKFTYIIDIEVFDQCYHNLKSISSTEEKISVYQKILDIYKGKFLSNQPSKEWIVPISTNLQATYLNSMYDFLKLLCDLGDYTKVIEYVKRIMVIDNLDEQIHQYMIYAFYKTGQINKSLSYYSHIRELFHRELGIELSERTKKLYNKICDSSKTNDIDIATFEKELKEESEDTTPLFCELEMFKQVYRFLARSAKRTSVSIYLVLITISGTDDDDIKATIRDTAVEQLQNSIQTCLRNGDVFAQPSPNQFAVILPYINFENCENVIYRIEKHFKNNYHSKKIRILHNSQLINED